MSFSVRVLAEHDRDVYRAFLVRDVFKPHVTFMHTWEWGEVMQHDASAFQRLGIYRDDKLVAVGQAARKPLRLGGFFWYCPRGLVMDYRDTSLVTEAYQAASRHFAGTGAAFFRADPDLVRGDPAEAAIDLLHPRQAAIFTQAERVWCADIQHSEAEQWSWLKEHGLAKKIPYYYRKAAREGVTVRVSDDPADLEKLIEGLNQLNDRKGGIGKHRDDYYRTQFGIMAPAGYERVFVAEKDGEVLASALIALFGREASYLHAASSEAHRELWAPRMLLIDVMLYCQKERPEIERLNFWGVVSDKNRNASHPRNGYSAFKRSFGGYKEDYVRARDFVYRMPAWRADWLLAKYRTWKYKND